MADDFIDYIFIYLSELPAAHAASFVYAAPRAISHSKGVSIAIWSPLYFASLIISSIIYFSQYLMAASLELLYSRTSFSMPDAIFQLSFYF